MPPVSEIKHGLQPVKCALYNSACDIIYIGFVSASIPGSIVCIHVALVDEYLDLFSALDGATMD